MYDWMLAFAQTLQGTPVSMERIQQAAIIIKANNDRVAKAGLSLSDMEDDPGTFDSWCRGFVKSSHDG